MSGVVELNDVQVALEFDVDKLVGRPEFGVDSLEELHDLLVELSLGDIWGLDEERDPIVAAIAVEVGSQEIVTIDEVSSAFIDEDDDVDLVVGINILFEPLVDQAHKASLEMEGRVGSDYSVEPQPSELAFSIEVGICKGTV